MAKRYVHTRDISKGSWEVDFTNKKEAAYHWSTRQDAESEAEMLEHLDIAIKTAEGQRHVCKGYQVEERALGEFVISCEAPFVLEMASA